MRETVRDIANVAGVKAAFEKYIVESTKSLDSEQARDGAFVCERLASGMAGGSYGEDDVAEYFYELEHFRGPLSFGAMEEVVRGITTEPESVIVLKEVIAQGVIEDHEGRSTEADPYGNYNHYEVHKILYGTIAEILAERFMRDPKAWITRLLRHESQNARLLGAALGTEWQKNLRGSARAR